MRARVAAHRRVSGWAAFVAVVVALRLLGLGSTPPPDVGAAALQTGTAATDPTDPTAGAAARALGWVVSAYDVAGFREATDRCLEAAPACAPEDLLEVDSTQLRLAGLAGALGTATDPSHADFVGEPDPWTGRRVTATRRAAEVAGGALASFLSAGCGGAVDGVAVTSPPHGCAELTAAARRALGSYRTAIEAWGGDR